MRFSDVLQHVIQRLEGKVTLSVVPPGSSHHGVVTRSARVIAAAQWFVAVCQAAGLIMRVVMRVRDVQHAQGIGQTIGTTLDNAMGVSDINGTSELCSWEIPEK